jgi:hypothetical protein
VVVEVAEAALVSRHEIVGFARFAHGQKVIVPGVGGPFDVRQRIYVLGEPFELVDQAAGLMRLDAFGYTRLCSVERSSSI